MAVNEKDIVALKKFLIDIDCLSSLSKWSSGFNFFEIAKISRAEIRHSNILAWLIDPTENHGLGDKMLQGIFQYLTEFEKNQADTIHMLLLDNYSFTVRREWNDIDILVISDDEEYVICIENKIGAKERKDTEEKEGQLRKYQRIIETNFPKYKAYFIFLTPDGCDAEDTENWHTMGYDTILDILTNATTMVRLSPEANMLINNYIDLLRRKIVNDTELVEICNKIYKKHRRALDLIFENKVDTVVEHCLKWAGENGRSTGKSNSTVTRFHSDEMDLYFPKQVAAGVWKDHTSYNFEIKRPDGKITLALVFDLTETANKNLEKAKAVSSKKPTGEKFWTAYSVTCDFDSDNFESEVLVEKLNSAWQEMQKETRRIIAEAKLSKV